MRRRMKKRMRRRRMRRRVCGGSTTQTRRRMLGRQMKMNPAARTLLRLQQQHAPPLPLAWQQQ
jgi:hypothetical protein